MTKTVTVLGTGIMGAGMARNLIGAGLDVTVWNRSPDRARPLADAGARIATDVAEAVAGADVVVTMLFDADSVAQVMEEALPGHGAGRGVGADLDRRAGGHRAAGRARGPPRRRLPRRARARYEGACGAGHADGARRRPVERCATRVAPVFDAIGSKTLWIGEQPGDGHKLKLVANSWVGMVTAGTAQAIALAGALGLDPQLFLDVIAGGPLDLPYAQLKGKSMIADEFPTSFAVSGVVKDLGLIAAAMRGADVHDGRRRGAGGSVPGSGRGGPRRRGHGRRRPRLPPEG